MQTIAEKPTLAQLLNRHHLTMPRLAQAARVRLSAVQAMAQNRPMQPYLAQQVLSGLFRLTGVCYRLEDVDVALVVVENRKEAKCPTIMTNDKGRG